jgi:methylmalonyl-CoA mutase
VQAAELRATLGEISFALEKVYGRYQVAATASAGVYIEEAGDNKEVQEARALADKFADLEGRRPRILVAKVGQDGHDRGEKAVATAFADLGWDVDVGPLFQTPKEVARQGIENDVHVIGVNSLAAGHNTLVPEIIRELEAQEQNILVVVGGVIPPQDYQFLFDQGVAAIFGPGTVLPVAAKNILTLLLQDEQATETKLAGAPK